MNQNEYIVPSDFGGSERLDKYIAAQNDGFNRSRLKALSKEITVNGKSEKISCKVKAGDKIVVLWEESVPQKFDAENIPLDIIYEDENVCVINKTQGMVVHPACGNWSGTLVNALLYHWGKESIQELSDENSSEAEKMANRRPGIVHRLDKETSGIIVTAKNPEIHFFLSEQFKSHKTIVKEYIAICMGRPQHKSGIIKTQIIRDPRDRKKFKAATDTNEGKLAITHYKCVACYGEYSLMRLRIKTGRTHQIRVHLKYLNCPILGDELYSKPDKKFSKATLMLHSKMLRIRINENSNELTEFKTKTPERFLQVMKILKRDYKKVILQDNK